MIVSVIVARSANKVIGIENRLPWHLPADLKHFKDITMGHHMIMGRKTWESIGKALPGRVSIVITRNKNYVASGAVVVHSLQEAIDYARLHNDTEAFIIGGAEIINECIASAVNKIYLTEIKAEFNGDAFLETPSPEQWKEIKRESFSKDEKNKWEYDFIELIRV